MEKLYIPLLLLNLTKSETQLLLFLFLIYESENKKESYEVSEIGKLMGISPECALDLLNKLLVKNIVGKIVMRGIVTPVISSNFDDDFLAILYDKKKPLESAMQKVKYKIKIDDTAFVLNPVIKSWRYVNKQSVVRVLKKLNKVIPENKFVTYLLEGYNYGKKGAKRKDSAGIINKSWTTQYAMDKFQKTFNTTYGNVYTPNSRDYKHMKNILIQLSGNNVKPEKLEEFFKYSFDNAVSRDYVIQVAGLKYYANQFLASIRKNTVRN